jgi:hypothetical protein
MKYLLQNKGQKAKINLEMGVGKLYITVNDKYRKTDGFTPYLFFSYIVRAGRLSHRDRYLSLSTAFRFFHAPTSVFFTSNDNDK